MTLTSAYAYLYNQYPFTNDPNAGPLHPDWWMTECACVPASTTPTPTFATPFRPMKYFDEERLLLGRTYKAGEVLRLTAPVGTAAASTVVDLIDTELVGSSRTCVWSRRMCCSSAPTPRAGRTRLPPSRRRSPPPRS